MGGHNRGDNYKDYMSVLPAGTSRDVPLHVMEVFKSRSSTVIITSEQQ